MVAMENASILIGKTDRPSPFSGSAAKVYLADLYIRTDRPSILLSVDHAQKCISQIFMSGQNDRASPFSGLAAKVYMADLLHRVRPIEYLLSVDQIKPSKISSASLRG